jgi:hypothetical protein
VGTCHTRLLIERASHPSELRTNLQIVDAEWISFSQQKQPDVAEMYVADFDGDLSILYLLITLEILPQHEKI